MLDQLNNEWFELTNPLAMVMLDFQGNSRPGFDKLVQGQISWFLNINNNLLLIERTIIAISRANSFEWP